MFDHLPVGLKRCLGLLLLSACAAPVNPAAPVAGGERLALSVYMVGSDLEDDIKPRNDAADEAETGQISIDRAGVRYVADQFNNRIRKITSGGQVTTLPGSGNSGLVKGDPVVAEFSLPSDVIVDAQGVLYIADYVNHSIRSSSR